MSEISINTNITKIFEDTILHLQQEFTSSFDISQLILEINNNDDNDYVLYYSYSFDKNNYADFKTKDTFVLPDNIQNITEPFFISILIKRKIKKDLGKPLTIYRVSTDNIESKEKNIELVKLTYNTVEISLIDETKIVYQSLYKIINEFPRWNFYDNQNVNIDRWFKQCNSIAEMYGHSVIYFRTEPLDSETINSFSNNVIRNVTSIKKLHINIPGNEIPQDRTVYSEWDLPLQDDFIINIVKDKFEQAFGISTLPHEKDYLYFPLVNKLYRISATQAVNKFMGKIAWWEVFLSKYEDDDCVKVNDELKEIYEGFEGFDVALDTISNLDKDIVVVDDNESSNIFDEVDSILGDGLLTKDKLDNITVEEKKLPTENYSNRLVDSTHYISLKETENLREYYNKRLTIVSINPDSEAFPISMYDNSTIDKRTVAIQYNLKDFTTKNKFDLTIKSKINLSFDFVLLNNFVGEIYDILDNTGNLPLFTIKNNRNKLEFIDNNTNESFTTNFTLNHKELYYIDFVYDFLINQFVIRIFGLIEKEKTLLYQDIYNIVTEKNAFTIGYLQLYGGNFYMGKTNLIINEKTILTDFVNPILVMKQF